jgi:hypothetical protein
MPKDSIREIRSMACIRNERTGRENKWLRQERCFILISPLKVIPWS